MRSRKSNAEGEREQQEELMWLTQVQNSPGGCHSDDTRPSLRTGLQEDILFNLKLCERVWCVLSSSFVLSSQL